ncbi:Outer membrane protein assembly factor BamB, contains PQQ-like beta-propeller repeat [Halobiforma haloterrestris]|uniref:Outer membrane protein assembly factor BamB, contains PQQ-like beta-propeller repeat n=1 Tax=Natronobacterium haloterrestre TaxID=148448 RepID=A0A1I1GJQ7_NATHA|nr:PQQ-binding-like beta-propeller repeat protein [Halobiforma haloterrestris]SFC10098.1 Outer membrane protein assembly factor BamB, contains PQQ-like beta-propeller repeat [Halobiforma haloterrestris]
MSARDTGTGDRPLGGEFRRRSLGDIEPARTRHMRTRSAVRVSDEGIFAGTRDGTVTAYGRDSLEPQWSATHPGRPVGIATLEGADERTVIVAGRGERGAIVAYDAETGDSRWRYDAAEDVGDPADTGVFALPYVVALESDGDGGLYAAARRYERDGDERRWESVVYAFGADGTVRWRYGTDASPIAIDLDTAEGADRVAVAYNRCPGRHDNGLVVLGAETGDLAWTWDPGTDGERRVGDVSLEGGRAAVASHGDKRGYLLESGGAERWRVDLAVETEIGAETLYAYPNHACLADGTVAFATGNTYAEEGRGTEHRHPNEHRLAVVDAETGDPLWDADLGGFVNGLASDDGTLVAPCAQNFRVRDPDTHAVRWFDLESESGGAAGTERFDGIAAAAAIHDGTIAAIEEPVEYHDEGETRGEYALHVGSVV